MCSNCIDIFPFNGCIEEEFCQLANNIYRSNWFYQNVNNSIFNPFQVNLDSEHYHSMDDHEPDINYYLKCQNLKNICNSDYYETDEYNNKITKISSSTLLTMFHKIRSASKNSGNISNFWMHF